jgi:hypothetical protein
MSTKKKKEGRAGATSPTASSSGDQQWCGGRIRRQWREHMDGGVRCERVWKKCAQGLDRGFIERSREGGAAVGRAQATNGHGGRWLYGFQERHLKEKE